MIPYIDMHCDTLMKAYFRRKKTIESMKNTMVDVRRLHQGGCRAQFFAIFMLPVTLKKYLGPFFPDDDKYIKSLLEIMHNTLEENGDVFALAHNYQEMNTYIEQKKVTAFLTLEDGRAIQGDMNKLEEFYNKGIRLITLTWNHENCFGAPNSDSKEIMTKGLTSFGKEAVERMNDLGMLVDVSHLSDGGFYDVASISKQPIVASHSNARKISPHRRNLTDEMIRTIGEKGGVIGLNFGGEFLQPDTTTKKSEIPFMIKHIKHMVQVGGIDAVCIGSDFDGIKGEFQIDSCLEMQVLFQALKKEGFHESQIEKIASRNIERVIKEVLK